MREYSARAGRGGDVKYQISRSVESQISPTGFRKVHGNVDTNLPDLCEVVCGEFATGRVREKGG